VIAAFLIFSVGYLALFLCIMICLVIARFILEGPKVAGARLVRPASANSCVSSEVETMDYVPDLFVGRLRRRFLLFHSCLLK
jgi:hypothetical protein